MWCRARVVTGVDDGLPDSAGLCAMLMFMSCVMDIFVLLWGMM